MKKRAQGTIEFMIVFAALLLFFIFFIALVGDSLSSKNEVKKNALLQSVAIDVRDEIRLASESSDGYSRVFNVPVNFLGEDFNISLQDNRVFVFLIDRSISYSIFNVSGDIMKGQNSIRKNGGIVYVNS